MGCFKPCYSVSGLIGSHEYVVLGLYDEQEARNQPPAFDDVLGEPFLQDNDDDGIGDRVRPEEVVTVLGRVNVIKRDEQRQDQVGNAPIARVEIIFSEPRLQELGIIVDGVSKIRANDRLLRVEDADGYVRIDFGTGLHCIEMMPGSTGEAVWIAVFERRRPVAT